MRRGAGYLADAMKAAAGAVVGVAKDLGQRSVNFVTALVQGDGFRWEDNFEKGFRLYTQNTEFQADSSMEVGEAHSVNAYRPDAEGKQFAAMYNRGDLDKNGYSDQKDKIQDLTDPDRNGQNSKSDYYKGMVDFVKDVQSGARELGLDEELQKSRTLMQGEIEVLKKQLMNENLTDKQKNDIAMKLVQCQQVVDDINVREAKVEFLKDKIMNAKDANSFASNIIGSTCNLQAYSIYGQVTGLDNRGFFTFFQEEFQKGNIGNVYSNGNYNLYEGAGSKEWDGKDHLDLTRVETPTGSTFVSNYELEKQKQQIAKKMGIDASQVEVTDEMIKKATKTEFYSATHVGANGKSLLGSLNSSNAQYAIVWMNTRQGSYSTETKGNHFFVIQRVGKTDSWRSYDHSNRERNGSPVDFSKIYGIRY